MTISLSISLLAFISSDSGALIISTEFPVLLVERFGCCDSSKNKHATKHYRRTQHPLIRSIEPGEAWIWCHVDEIVPGRPEGTQPRSHGDVNRGAEALLFRTQFHSTTRDAETCVISLQSRFLPVTHCRRLENPPKSQ
jgi:hypothetical protein